MVYPVRAVAAILLVCVMLVPVGAAVVQRTPPGVAVVLVRGATDPAWFKGVAAWVDRAVLEFPTVRLRVFDVDLTKHRDPEGTQPSPLLERLHAISSGFGVVVVVGMVSSDAVREVAAAFPGVRYIVVDGWYVSGLKPSPNVRYTLFKEEQGAFLAGALAGLLTETGRVGFIGSMRVFPHLSHMAGFVAGVRFVAPRTGVLVDYVAVDPEAALLEVKWQQVVQAQFALGADIIYVSGAPSLDAPLRAAPAGRWIIGVDGPTADESPADLREHLLMRVVNDYGRVVYDVVRALAANVPDRGASYALGDGVSYTVEPLKVTGPHVARLKEIEQAIVRGSLAVPYDSQTLERFLERH